MLESAKLDVEGIIANGKKTLEAEKVKMVAEAKKEIVSLTMLTTERLLGHKLDESYDEKTIEKLSKN